MDALLHEGIECIFSCWTALQMAVEGQWGGVETSDKYRWFIDTISDYLIKEGSHLDPLDLEEILEQILSDEFFVQLEDNSARQVATSIVSLYQDLVNGDTTLLERHRALAASKQPSTLLPKEDTEESEGDQMDATESNLRSLKEDEEGWIYY